MNQWLRNNMDKLALAGAVIVIAGVAFGAVSNNSPVAKPPQGQFRTNTQKTGETAMSTATTQENKVHHADETNFAELVLNSDVPVLVDFYADWCGPCRMIAPVLDELAEETIDARIVKVNVDQSPELAARYGVNSIPNLKVFDDGKVVDEQVGLASKDRLKAMLDI
jgi:thioredoxin 1